MVGTDPTTETPTLGQAARALDNVNRDWASVQNGIGFNKLDSDFGHSLASKDEANWSPRMKFAAYKMLRKYRAQLLRMGIDFSAIPYPTDHVVDESKKAGVRKISLRQDKSFLVTFPYDPQIVGAIRAVPGREWSSVMKAWFVPFVPASADALYKVATDFKFEFADGVESLLRGLSEQGQTMAEHSKASDAEIEIDGLGGELHPFQRAGVRYLMKAVSETGGAILGDEMGLGKTVQALALFQAFRNAGKDAFPALVVVPNSVKRKWAREVEKWLPGRRALIVTGTKPVRLTDFDGRSLGDIVIINWDLLRHHASAFAETGHFRFMVCDESHNIKSHKAQRTQAVLKLTQHIPYRLLMSGTAILNRPDELVTQLQVIGRIHEFGSVNRFESLFCRGAKGMRLKELNTRMRSSFYVARAKMDVVKELPAIQRSMEILPLSNREIYDRAADDFVGWLMEQDLGKEKIEAALRAEAIVRLTTLKRLAARGKLEAAVEWMRDFLANSESNGDSPKLIVFAHHNDLQDSLMVRFPDAAHVLSKDSVAVRQAQADRFQSDPQCRLIICSLEAGSEGIDLTAASNVAFLELAWTPGRMDQAEGRCYGRVNDPHGATAWYLLAEDTVDEYMAELLDEKRETTKAVLQGEDVEEGSMLVALLRRMQEAIIAKRLASA